MNLHLEIEPYKGVWIMSLEIRKGNIPLAVVSKTLEGRDFFCLIPEVIDKIKEATDIVKMIHAKSEEKK